MAKNNLVYNCSHCGAQFQKWTGRCLECGQWGTIDKNPVAAKKTDADTAEQYAPAQLVGLSDIKETATARIKTGTDELDNVLGGGLVPGSLILLGGEPGIGKSTLALQIACALPDVLYFSGEESVEQIKLRANRIKFENNKNPSIKLANETSAEAIIAAIKKIKPKLAIIDSIQTVSSGEVDNGAGGVSQIRACTAKFLEAAKQSGVVIILIGQVTKDGDVAGPRTLEHLVDTVLYLEGDRYHQFRILRAAKNRFGSTDEVGIFEMVESGLKEVKNPSQAFLNGRPENVPGSAVTCLMEGTRPLLFEIQALVSKTAFGYPVRKASGFDLNRLQVLAAVLSRRTGLPLDTYDIFLNVVGGVKAEEPAADLAVILAIASAMKNKTLPSNLAAFGEVGLGGEVRPVSQAKRRLEEIKKLGFEFVVTPTMSDNPKIPGLKIAPIKNVAEIIEKILEK